MSYTVNWHETVAAHSTNCKIIKTLKGEKMFKELEAKLSVEKERSK